MKLFFQIRPSCLSLHVFILSVQVPVFKQELFSELYFNAVKFQMALFFKVRMLKNS